MTNIQKSEPFEKPAFEMIPVPETDIILTSGEPLTETPQEGEFIPA